MKKILILILGVLCAACAKVDNLEGTSEPNLSSLHAIVYYAAPDYTKYETLDLLSGMHVSDEVERYSITITLGGNITEQSLKCVRLEAIIPSTCTLEMADSEWKKLGYGLSEIKEIGAQTLRFIVENNTKTVKKYEISIRVKE